MRNEAWVPEYYGLSYLVGQLSSAHAQILRDPHKSWPDGTHSLTWGPYISDHTHVSGESHDPTFSQMETLDSQNLVVGDEHAPFPCLTIVYHPQLSRIGEQAVLMALLGHTPVELSRKTPDFAHPGSDKCTPLRDPFVSRSPVILERLDEDFLAITPTKGGQLQIDERKITGPVDIPMEKLWEGVLLILSRRIVLLLHVMTMQDRAPLPGMIGESEGIRLVRRQIAQVADLEVPVLIRGETGVGKELVARSIHSASRRASGPFRAINMATVQAGTGSSILFGHLRGAFTGATARQPGLFKEADQGTLFMDEVGDTPPRIQPMLLRALSEGLIMPLGAVKEIPVDVRIIAATDLDIEQGAEDGTFRAALHHRLSGFEMRVPPLRERREDIPRLVLHFLEKILEEIDERSRLTPPETERLMWFPPALMIRFFYHDWPGNVRQLYNAVRQLVISNRGLGALKLDSHTRGVLYESRSHDSARLPRLQTQPPFAEMQLEDMSEPMIVPQIPNTAPRSQNNRRSSREISDEAVYEALQRNNWLIGPASEDLGMPRSTLYGRIEKHPLIRKAGDLTRPEIEDALIQCRGDVHQVVQLLQVSPRGLRLRIRALGIDPSDYR